MKIIEALVEHNLTTHEVFDVVIGIFAKNDVALGLFGTLLGVGKIKNYDIPEVFETIFEEEKHAEIINVLNITIQTKFATPELFAEVFEGFTGNGEPQKTLQLCRMTVGIG